MVELFSNKGADEDCNFTRKNISPRNVDIVAVILSLTLNYIVLDILLVTLNRQLFSERTSYQEMMINSQIFLKSQDPVKTQCEQCVKNSV